MKKRRFFIAIFALIATLSIAFAACVKDVSGSEVGVYYFDAEDGEYNLTLSEETKFTLTLNSQTLSGTYKLEGESLTLKFNDKGVEDVVATYRNDEITLTFNSSTMKFIRKINYTVTFVINGGSSVSSQTVVNGRTVSKVDDPTRGGYVFIGWYADEDLTVPYDFTSAVTENITLYAKWQEVSDGRTEHTVTFDGNYDGADVTVVETVNSKITAPSAPTRAGYSFVGWFVSMYDDGAKLTYKFDDTATVTEDMVVFAAWSSVDNYDLGVSVSEKQISWNAVSNASSYTVTVKTVDGVVIKDNAITQRTIYTEVDFSTLPAADYIIEVSGSGLAGVTVRYFRNKALAKVTGLHIVDDTMLVFDPVEHAEKYLITIDCGNNSHNHTLYDIGNSTSYNFSACEMQPGGITFVVTAVAEGYLSSESDKLVYVKDLDSVTGIEYDATTETISWNGVDNATEYVVTLTNGADVVEIYNGNATSICVKQYAKGQYTVKVVATSWGYNESESETYSFTKETIATPSDVKVNGTTVSWSAVTGATSYKLVIGSQEIDVNGTSYDIASIVNNWTQDDNYTLSVIAVGDKNSLPSDPLDIRYLVEKGTLIYSNGYVSWSPVEGIAKYAVRLNGDEIAQISDGYSVAVPFSKTGNNVIALISIDDNGNQSELAVIEVYVYSITFDVSGGEAIDNATIYLAKGDEISYPSESDIVRAGYDFMGWYTAPDGDINRRHFTDKYFNGDSNTVLYASWDVTGVYLTYNYGAYSDGSATETQARVYYGSDYKLVVPTTESETVVFAGWYTEANGNGERLTDENGNSVAPWTGAEGIDVYAYWAQIFAYIAHEDGTYGVAKGPGINYVTSVTVPETYNGSKITVVEGFAFSSCLRLDSISIPNTVTLIESTAFEGCLNLKNIYIYDAGAIEVFYFNVDGDGVVFKREESGTSLANFPLGRTGSYTVPDGITQLPSNIFAGAFVTEIKLSNDVTYIGSYAFYNCTKLENIVLGNNSALTIGDYAFQNCVSLTSITIPDGVEFNLNIFDGCSSLAAIYANNSTYFSSEGMLVSGTTLVYAPKGISSVRILAPIKAIGDYAFQNCSKLEEIVIPDFVDSIGINAFYNCSALISVSFNGTNAEGIADIVIGDKAFANNRSLKTVTFNNFNVSMGEYVFSDCPMLETVLFDDSKATTISAYTFWNDYSLATVTLPDNLSVIDSYAFANCVSLGTIYLPGSVNEIGQYAFSGCELLSIVEFANTDYDLIVSSHAFDGTSSLATINLPNGTKSIGEYAFVASGLTTIEIPNSVEEINSYAFRNNTSLRYVRLPDSLTYLGLRVFEGCSGLTVNIGNSDYPFDFVRDFAGADIADIEMGDNYDSDNGLIYNADKTELLGYIGTNESVTIAATVTSIGMNVFQDTPAKYVSFADGSEITRIGDYAFAYAGNLETVTLPDSVTEISQYAFMGSASLRVVGGGNIETIGQMAFWGATALSEIDISHVTRMGQRAFYDAASLQSVTLSPELTTIPSFAFNGCTSLTTVNLNNVTIIGERAFDGTALTSVTLSDDLTTMADYAFAGTGLTSIALPNNLTSLGLYVFADCKSLASVTLGDKIEVISTGAFSGCSSLVTIDLSKCKTIGSSAFSGCSLLSSISLDNVTRIESSAFSNCSSLKTVTLNENFEGSISYNTFYNCTSLESINLPDGVYEIGSRAFANCTSLQSIDLPSSLEWLEDEAFAGCTSLKSVDFSACANLTELYEGVFSGCSSLESIDLSPCASLAEIPDNVFRGCSSLKEITLPRRLTGMGQNVFDGCTSLETIVATGTTFYAVDGVLFDLNSKSLFAYPLGKTDEEYEIPDIVNRKNTITTVSQYAFAGNAYLTKVTIPAAITTVERYAFLNCTSLQTVAFAANSRAVCAQDAFSGCSSITAVELGDNASPDIGNIFAGSRITEIVIPSDVVTISSNAYANMPYLTTVSFQEGSQLHTIGYGAFMNCPSLVTIDMSNCTLLTEIGNDVFSKCESLQNVYLPSNLTTIGNRAFEGCVSLTSIVIPASVSSLAVDAFNGCINLRDIRIHQDNESYSFENGVLYNAGKTILIKYLSINTATSFRVVESVTEIATYAFQYNTTLEDVVLPYGLHTIGNNAFDGSRIKSINIPASVTLIRMHAFKDCAYLKTLTFETGGSDILTIAQSSFVNCTALESIVFPARLRTKSSEITGTNNAAGIGNSAFQGCTSLKTISFETDPTFTTMDDMKYLTLGDYAFEDCTSLETVTLPTYVASYVSYISGLKKGNAIGLATFRNCTSLRVVNILTTEDFSIGDYAFRGCTAIKELRLPSSLRHVGSYAFYGWTAEQTIYMTGIPQSQSNSWGDSLNGPWTDDKTCSAVIVWNA